MSRPLTITEKILQSWSNQKDIQPGQVIMAKIGLGYANDFIGEIIFEEIEKRGGFYNKNTFVMVFDHSVPVADVAWAGVQSRLRRKCNEHGILLYDIGNHGIMHHMMVQHRHLLPGMIAIGTDSHAPTLGAVGAIVLGVGSSDLAAAMATGELWLQVPKQVKVNLDGNLNPGVMARDIACFLLLEKGWDGGEAQWSYHSLEFSGSLLHTLNMDERFSLCSLAAATGIKNAIIAPDQITKKYYKSFKLDIKQSLSSDINADYHEIMDVNVSYIQPMVACPHHPANIKPITQVQGTRINTAFIGTCSNGRLNDLIEAANILKNHKVNPEVRFIISPASQQIYEQASELGLLSVFSKAGAVVAPSSCGPCFGGQMVILSKGDVAIGTGPRNTKGRMGSPEAMIYNANPQTVAASAITGEITDPRSFL